MAVRSALSRRSAAALRPAQGTRDHHPAQMALRERLFRTVVTCFKRHGAAAIDTPVLELRVRTWSRGSRCAGRRGTSTGVPQWEWVPFCPMRFFRGTSPCLCSLPFIQGAGGLQGDGEAVLLSRASQTEEQTLYLSDGSQLSFGWGHCSEVPDRRLLTPLLVLCAEDCMLCVSLCLASSSDCHLVSL